MTPREFIEKWRDNPLKERASYQMHFLDLCALLGVDPPAPASHETYCFERGATRTGAGQGWADVWKKGCFAFEYKASRRNLGEALKQLMTYALALDNPPLLVVCDTGIIEIHTHFTNAPSEVHTIALEDIGEPANLEKLRWLFADPDKFHPRRTIAQITEEAAGKFADLAQSLTGRGHAPQAVAHFLNQCLFCLFAEDAGLLPGKLFERLLDKSQGDPAKLAARLEELFAAMRRGGDFALEDIHWFNGGLFENIRALPLAAAEIRILHDAAKLDWSGIEPSIFGTLFERGLDPQKRSQLGAHYTDAQSILRIIAPVISEPLAAAWESAKAGIAECMALYQKGGKGSQKAFQEAGALLHGYLERLRNFRVLDPACGSGNFLFLALRALKDLEHKANLEAEALGLQRALSIETSPANVLGIELNSYAAELARVTVWIGEIQWMLKNGYPIRKNPILQPLDHIENRDALLTVSVGACPAREQMPSRAGHAPTSGSIADVVSEASWPAVDVIIGNPPFLGGSKMRGELGDEYTDTLRKVYEGRVPGGADLVTYWFEKARAQIEAGKCRRAGLVATNSIRGGANQQVLARILNTVAIPAQAGIQTIEKLDSGLRRNDKTMQIFNAWSDEPWINEGAAVRVSLVCFESVRPEPFGVAQDRLVEGRADVQTIHAASTGSGQASTSSARTVFLDGRPVQSIHADLTAGEGLNLTQAKPLKENARGVCFMGASKKAPFDIPGDLARQWLKLPNPNGRPNSDVVRPLCNAMNITSRPSDTWIVDFGTDMSEADAALYEAPFEYVVQHVKPVSEKNRDKVVARNWWRHARPRIDMRSALTPLKRFIATPAVSKHRLFVFLDAFVLPDQATLAIACSDDTTFGILHSRFHELWALRMGTSLEDRPRYTPTTTFETFPFPEGLVPGFSIPSNAHNVLASSNNEQSILNAEETEALRRDLKQTVQTSRAINIAVAAQKLIELRENWLNPPEWTDWVRTLEEEKAGFPLRPVAKPGHEAGLNKRTLTNLYNARPAWLNNAHQELDAAVARAYGWNDYTPEMSDEEILRRLLALNQAR